MLSKFIKKFAQYQLILPIKASFERSLMGRKSVLKNVKAPFL
ncbi:Hypothetical protein CSEC_2374 [Criblamydia sequanensis CRIB-18]|uniref:Uncharacterized protein n=1 Tax=Candidatus Criblamydia sequanensis CRIB-18 TaxID=1437425 RepID=A0A090D344_9BACT|nr:Hypothetical protein CSEC_2374 [Criblamydia sequanensis CRIB-18]